MVHVEVGNHWGYLKNYCPPMSQIQPSQDTPLGKTLWILSILGHEEINVGQWSIYDLNRASLLISPLEVCHRWDQFRNELYMLKLVPNGIIWRNIAGQWGRYGTQRIPLLKCFSVKFFYIISWRNKCCSMRQIWRS